MRSLFGPRANDDVKDAFAWLKSVSVSALRPWSEFFADFRIPESGWAALERQAGVNAAYFAANYTFVMIGMQLLTIVQSPLLIVGLVLCAVLVTLLHKPPRNMAAAIDGLFPRDWHRAAAGVAGCACLLLAMGYLWAVFANAFLGLLLAVVHMLTRRPSPKAKAVKMWFNLTKFGERVIDDIPERGAATSAPAARGWGRRDAAGVDVDPLAVAHGAAEESEELDLEAAAVAAPDAYMQPHGLAGPQAGMHARAAKRD